MLEAADRLRELLVDVPNNLSRVQKKKASASSASASSDHTLECSSRPPLNSSRSATCLLESAPRSTLIMALPGNSM